MPGTDRRSDPRVTALTELETLELKRTALRVRRNILRMFKAGGSGHLGGALSAADILTALYFRVMRVDPENPLWRERDRFVLSAGHKCLGLYAVLAQRGFFDLEVLDSYGALESRVAGHPDMHMLPGVEASTGALGHGLAIAGGMAMGLRMDRLDSRVYVLLGDGELAEGSNWEAAAACSHHRLDNLLAFVDRNALQISGRTAEVMNYEPVGGRLEAFGWSVREIDGHDFAQIVENAGEMPFEAGRPSAVVANTVKSRGFSFAEDRVDYHHWKPTPEEIRLAERDLAEIEGSLAE